MKNNCFRRSTMFIISFLIIHILFNPVIISSAEEYHEPIGIYGDGYFEDPFFEIRNEIDGNGSPSNPYVIEGWTICLTSRILNGISIKNLSSYIIIKNITIIREYDYYSDTLRTLSVPGFFACGIRLVNVSNVTIENCRIINNENGIILQNCTNIKIFHNDIINSFLYQAYDDNGNQNSWDNGYPSGGNYWSDYKWEDEYSGPEQDIDGSDGIGDRPYYIDYDDSWDNYPLMEEYNSEEKSDWMVVILIIGVTFLIASALIIYFTKKRNR